MLSFAELLERLDITRNEEHIKLPGAIESMPVQFGGPVEPGRGFVLHTADYYSSETTLPIDEGVALTATLDILRAIAQGTGPRRVLLALGYAGWGPASSMTKYSAMAGCIAPPMRNCCSRRPRKQIRCSASQDRRRSIDAVGALRPRLRLSSD